ncbi:17360_t:CDS:2 [Dentiscutata erythropus]|uniref:17360_t:CDS:1 n=1 Tax=Dentiscutata erythropus TaxID=1348616 RepID=A0A9N9GV17_9GLOM|nr:17360_t:CDS:2 [Dentiscutata erythropus]
MVLGKIFRKDRKTEPTSVFSLRIIVSTFSFTNANSIPVPMLIFSNIPMKSHINCYFTYAVNNTREDNKACNQYIRQPVFDTTSANYISYFQADDDLLFSPNFNDSLKNIGITVYIDDATYNGKNLSTSINLIAIDTDLYNTYGSKLFEDQGYQDSVFFNSIIEMNTYKLLSNQASFIIFSYDIQIKRSIKKFMTKSWKNYLGYTPDLETIPYITSTIGTNAIQPWGLVQTNVFKYNQTELLKTLESMQFLDHLTHNTDNLEDQLFTEKLENRLDSLQLFLRDYVVNVQYLEKINKKLNSNI